jgi:hypothetical protein
MKSILLAIMLLGASFSTSAMAHPFDGIIAAARAKQLPTKILQEVVQANSSIAIKSTSGGPRYQPGYFYGGTIYLPFANKSPSTWGAIDWTHFYNEAFHAWWGNIFLKSSSYKTQMKKLTSNHALISKYKRANPHNPKLAMEEGYSETVASMMMMAYPRVRKDPVTGDWIRVPPKYETLYYNIGRTVAAVSHSDRPGYTAAAESTYLDHAEYNQLMNWIFGKNAPVIP